MKRRKFLQLAGGAAITWSLAAFGQEQTKPVIGLLSAVSFESYADRIIAFRQGLKTAGFVEGQNVLIEYRSAEGRSERLRSLADDLVGRNVAVIVALASSSPLAAHEATSTIPIVFAHGSDPVAYGIVKNLTRPEANVTGVSFFSNTLGAKRLELLHALVPAASSVGFLINSGLTGQKQTALDVDDMRAAADARGLQLTVLDVGTEKEIDVAFNTIAQRRLAALVVNNDAYLNSRRAQIIALAAKHAVPAMYAYREHVAAGGLICYGTDVTEMYRQAGIYTARILKGEKPADLPVLLPTKFELIVNLNTAKALGVAVPQSLLALATEVIE